MDDLISRQAALDIVFDFAEAPHNMYQKIRELPSAEKHGKWIGGEIGRCSVCGHSGCASDIWSGCETLYCPNCGARMERSEAELKDICPLRECNNCKEICPTTYFWCE